MKKEYLELKEKEVEYKLKATKQDFNRAKITKSKDAADYARQFYFDDLMIYESVFIIMLNRRNNTCGYAKISQGGISGTVVDIRLILKYAIESLASGIILVHNHPSGNMVASPQDIQIAKKLKEAAMYMDISLLDSIIISEDSHYSLADEGLI
jgi:DNA repair protein RadC